MDSFEAEAKRSWFSLRDSLKAATKGGKLWVPAVVTLADGWVKIHTSEGGLEFRPRRLRWIEADSFHISGLDKGFTFRHSDLRFKGPEQASLVASIMKQSSMIEEEEALVPVEEFPVQARLLLSGRYVVIQLSALFIRLIVAGFIFLFLGLFGILGVVAGIAAVISYMGIPAWMVFVKARRTTQGWLRLQGKSVAVRTSMDWAPIIPKVIERRTSTVFVLRGSGTKHELSFASAENATQASLMIRSSRPEVQEIRADLSL